MSLRGYVRDAGGGIVTIVIERDTESYPIIGTMVKIEEYFTNWRTCPWCRDLLGMGDNTTDEVEHPWTCPKCGEVWS